MNRILLNFEHNQTPSVVPGCFFNPELPVAQKVSDLFSPEREVSREGLDSAVRDHFELRLELFFQQLLTTYRCGKEFFIEKTYLQASLKKTEPDPDAPPFNEAHASTLPALLTDALVLEGPSFGGLSHFSFLHNTTAKLPKFVNEVDSGLDFQFKFTAFAKRRFREAALDFLNRNSRGEMNPLQAFDGFLLALGSAFEEMQQKALVLGWGPSKSRVLACYQEVWQSYRSQGSFLLDGFFTRGFSLLSPEEKEQGYTRLGRQLCRKMEIEEKLFQKVESLKTRFFAAGYNQEEKVKCLLLKLSKFKSAQGRLAAERLKPFQSIIAGATFLKYYRLARDSQAVADLVIPYLRRRRERDKKFFSKTLPQMRQNRFFQNLQTAVKACIIKKHPGLRSPSHLDLLALKVMAHFANQMPKKPKLAEGRMRAFLLVEDRWASDAKAKYPGVKKALSRMVRKDVTFQRQAVDPEVARIYREMQPLLQEWAGISSALGQSPDGL
ncbi:MAG: hypothetical protein WC371_05620 [Parachlamydiales bacterium]